MINNKQDVINILSELIHINTIETEHLDGMPFGEGNAKALNYLLAIMKENNFRVKNIENYCGYAEIGEGELFGILSHLDVVPADGEWKYPPFSATIVDNKMYGRGTMDDKGPTIACIYACIKLLKEGLTPKKRIRFIFGCNEESGWKCMERYKQTEEIPEIGFSPDADFPVINCEKGILHQTFEIDLPSTIEYIKAGSRVNIVPDKAETSVKYDLDIYNEAIKKDANIKIINNCLQIVCLGKSAHASTPEEGDNALIKLLDILGIKYHKLKNISDKFRTTNGKNAGIKLKDKQSGNLTVNLGKATTIDNKIVFDFDIRYPITFKAEYINKILSENIQEEIKITNNQLPLYVEPNSKLVCQLLKAYNKVMNTNLKPITIGGGTYARMLKNGVAFGAQFPNTKSTIHQKDEYIDLDDFDNMINIYYEALKNLCF